MLLAIVCAVNFLDVDLWMTDAKISWRSLKKGACANYNNTHKQSELGWCLLMRPHHRFPVSCVLMLWD